MKVIIVLSACTLITTAAFALNSQSDQKSMIAHDVLQPQSESLQPQVMVADLEEVGACRQYWKGTGTLIQCNMTTRATCGGNPLIRYSFDPSGSC